MLRLAEELEYQASLWAGQFVSTQAPINVYVSDPEMILSKSEVMELLTSTADLLNELARSQISPVLFAPTFTGEYRWPVLYRGQSYSLTIALTWQSDTRQLIIHVPKEISHGTIRAAPHLVDPAIHQLLAEIEAKCDPL